MRLVWSCREMFLGNSAAFPLGTMVERETTLIPTLPSLGCSTRSRVNAVNASKFLLLDANKSKMFVRFLAVLLAGPFRGQSGSLAFWILGWLKHRI